MGDVISAEELRGRIGEVRVVDARSGPAGLEGYAKAHVLGAVHADLDRDLAGPADHPERGGRHPLPDPKLFAAKLGEWGIGPETEVVVYDDKGGANAAARLWWMLRAFGHESVAVLDGGWQAALEARLATTAELPSIEPLPPYPAEAFGAPVVDVDEVATRVREPEWLVLDVREAPRYRGEAEPIDPVAGHIPGAANLFFGENLDADGRFLPPEELARRYRALIGDRDPDKVIVHCGSGVTACHTLLALERAGLPGASLYVGSWSEWSRDPSRPREPEG